MGILESSETSRLQNWFFTGKVGSTHILIINAYTLFLKIENSVICNIVCELLFKESYFDLKIG